MTQVHGTAAIVEFPVANPTLTKFEAMHPQTHFAENCRLPRHLFGLGILSFLEWRPKRQGPAPIDQTKHAPGRVIRGAILVMGYSRV
jgi:hypothetical protein